MNKVQRLVTCSKYSTKHFDGLSHENDIVSFKFVQLTFPKVAASQIAVDITTKRSQVPVHTFLENLSSNSSVLLPFFFENINNTHPFLLLFSCCSFFYSGNEFYCSVSYFPHACFPHHTTVSNPVF